MIKKSFVNDRDIDEMRRLLSELGEKCSIVDFEEHIQLKTVRETLRFWRERDVLVGFGYVDDFCNLLFETQPNNSSTNLEDEIIAWGSRCIQDRNDESGEKNTLDHCCNADNARRIEALLRNGFRQEPQRALKFRRLLAKPPEKAHFPHGYTWRCVNNQDSIESLVALHQAAFGTQNMTVEYRQAMMNAPQYQPELDLVAVAPDGSLAAFCICGFEEPGSDTGFTDPIGTHPDHQYKGLAKALVTIGLELLAKSGAQQVELGTSSENIAMQKLAESLGFNCISEKLWFSKEICLE